MKSKEDIAMDKAVTKVLDYIQDSEIKACGEKEGRLPVSEQRAYFIAITSYAISESIKPNDILKEWRKIEDTELEDQWIVHGLEIEEIERAGCK